MNNNQEEVPWNILLLQEVGYKLIEIQGWGERGCLTKFFWIKYFPLFLSCATLEGVKKEIIFGLQSNDICTEEGCLMINCMEWSN